MHTTLPPLQQDTLIAGSNNSLPIGTRLADFEITGIIGEGGFGIVYQAFDHSLQRTVAIKEYMPAIFASRSSDKSVRVRLRRDEETFAIGLKSFINEARLLAQFDHPGLIRVYRFWEENKTGYMAMRYYEGRTLKNIVAKDTAQVTESWLKSILRPILEALDTLYKVNVLHRDISPENIMIQANGEAVLLDFGAARQIINDGAHAFTIILKPGYAPIEQYAADSSMTQGPWTDIYSLSAVIYFAIAKKLPPPSVARIIKDPIEPLQDREYAGFSKEFLAAIDRGLAVKPTERPQSIEAFRKLLNLDIHAPAQGGAPVTAFMPPQWQDTSDKRQRRSQSADRLPGSDKRHATPGDAIKLKKSGTVLLALATAGILWGAGAAGYYLFKPNSHGSIDTDSPSLFDVTEMLASSDTGMESTIWQAPDTKPDARSADGSANSARVSKNDAIEHTRTKPVSASTPVSRKIEAKPEALPRQQAKPKAQGKAEGVVILNIKPWGKVSVNGTSKGASPPLKQLVLPEGRHLIKIENPSFPGEIIEVNVTRKKNVTVNYDFSAFKKFR